MIKIQDFYDCFIACSNNMFQFDLETLKDHFGWLPSWFLQLSEDSCLHFLYSSLRKPDKDCSIQINNSKLYFHKPIYCFTAYH